MPTRFRYSALLAPLALAALPRVSPAQGPCAIRDVWERVVDPAAPRAMHAWLRVSQQPCGEAGRLRLITDHAIDLSVANILISLDSADFIVEGAGGLHFGGHMDSTRTRIVGVMTAGGRLIPTEFRKLDAEPAVVDTALITGGTHSAAQWPIPAGWSAEGFVLPLAWAPDVPFTGAEVTRTAPGFAKADAPGHWTYAFAWLAAGDSASVTAHDAATLSKALVTYYRGLSAAMGVQPSRVDSLTAASLAPAGYEGAWSTFTGTLTMLDPFDRGIAVTLDATIRVRSCGNASTAIVIGISPNGADTAPVREMKQLLSRFECH